MSDYIHNMYKNIVLWTYIGGCQNGIIIITYKKYEHLKLSRLFATKYKKIFNQLTSKA